jgi:hypothetical protein
MLGTSYPNTFADDYNARGLLELGAHPSWFSATAVARVVSVDIINHVVMMYVGWL